MRAQLCFDHESRKRILRYVSESRFWVKAGLAVAGLAAVFFVTRWSAVEIFAAVQRGQWAARPEIENWANPYQGSEVAANCVAVLVLAAAALVCVVAYRRARNPKVATA